MLTSGTPSRYAAVYRAAQFVRGQNGSLEHALAEIKRSVRLGGLGKFLEVWGGPTRCVAQAARRRPARSLSMASLRAGAPCERKQRGEFFADPLATTGGQVYAGIPEPSLAPPKTASIQSQRAGV